MNITKPIIVGLSALALCLAGCGKGKNAQDMKPIGMQDVDIAKLQNVFSNATPEMATALKDVAYGLRYSDPMKSLMALDKLANDPQANDAQKKVVTETTEQVKKLAAQQQQENPAPAQ